MGNERKDLLCELGLEDSVVFEHPDYDSAIIGYDANDSRVIYDFEKNGRASYESG